MNRRPGVLAGIVFGAVLTLPLMAVMAVGATVGGFGFMPFSLLDWLARYLPGPLITFGIDSLVSVITTFDLGPTSEIAKTAEQLMSLGLLPIVGALAGGLFFFLRGRLQGKDSIGVPGLILGLIVAAVLLMMFFAVPVNGIADNLSNAVWNTGLLILWGVALSYIWHALAFRVREDARVQPPSVKALTRREFIVQVGASTAAVTVVGTGLSALLNARPPEVTGNAVALAVTPEVTPPTLPNAGDVVAPAPGTRPELTPIAQHYRIDINASLPYVDGDSWTLRFTSALEGGDKQLVKEYTLNDLMAFPRQEAYLTMACISNQVGGDLISTTRWTGSNMQEVLADVGIPAGATHLKITSADGFDETVALDLIAQDDRIMLAYWWDGQLLPQRNGFPLRIHIPDRYGMKQPKWITEIEFLSADQDGYWVRRGWDREAFVRTTSVIDTVAVDAAYEQDGSLYIPVGGIAWSGAREISRVEVRVNGGEWQEAQLRSAISERTWRIWRFDWPFTAGPHTFEVRCQEGDGTPQIETREGTRPSGATGLHSATATLPSALEPASGA